MPLSPGMTLKEFDHGYWYALELKAFAAGIGVRQAAKLRKDELEAAIRSFLQTGSVAGGGRELKPAAPVKDVEQGLRLARRVAVYTNDAETKEFLEREALRVELGHKRRSGSRYRLNRWREEQIALGVKITYGDLVREYVRLNLPGTAYERTPQVRYVNFLSDFFAAESAAVRADGLQAWRDVKKLDGPKTYRAWKRAQTAR